MVVFNHAAWASYVQHYSAVWYSKARANSVHLVDTQSLNFSELTDRGTHSCSLFTAVRSNVPGSLLAMSFIILRKVMAFKRFVAFSTVLSGRRKPNSSRCRNFVPLTSALLAATKASCTFYPDLSEAALGCTMLSKRTLVFTLHMTTSLRLVN